ncbi:MAG: LysR family transcriptional regulator [Burkholderiaceae bacterium]
MRVGRMNFRQLDLNLLRVLAAVYRTGSVTAAGRQLALSQPATSNALARLREFFGDELFVRSPRGLHPTHVAQRIAPAVIAHLQALESTVLSAEAFDPATSRVHWRLSLSDLGEILFLPPLAHVLRRAAPNCALSNVAVAAEQVSAALEARDVDLAIGILKPGHRGIASEPLFQEGFVGITAIDWMPPAGRSGRTLNAQQLARAAIAVATPTATVHGSVEARLKQLKLAERAVLHVRHFGALPELVARTDLLAIVPRRFAESLAPRYAVRIWALPDVVPRYEVRMLWHPSADGDPAHAWLRALVRKLFARGVRG